MLNAYVKQFGAIRALKYIPDVCFKNGWVKDEWVKEAAVDLKRYLRMPAEKKEGLPHFDWGGWFQYEWNVLDKMFGRESSPPYLTPKLSDKHWDIILSEVKKVDVLEVLPDNRLTQRDFYDREMLYKKFDETPAKYITADRP